MIIRLLEPKDAPQVAKIHRQSIHTGFMSTLPPTFLESLYRVISQSKLAFGFVCENEGVILGFICVGVDSGKLFKELIFKRGIYLMIPLLRHIFNISAVKKILDNILYPTKFGGDFPKAEILSVAVNGDAKGTGVGRNLMEKSITELKRRNISGVRAMTDEANKASNSYYQKNGFHLVKTIKHHDHRSNLYVLTL